MKTLLAVGVCGVVVALAGVAQERYSETLSPVPKKIEFPETRWLDMACGPEVSDLSHQVIDAQDIGKLPTLTINAKDADLQATLPAPARKFDIKLIVTSHPKEEFRRSGIIFTHTSKDSRLRLVLVRTRFSGKDNFEWSVLCIPKEITRYGCLVSRAYEVGNNQELEDLLKSILPPSELVPR